MFGEKEKQKVSKFASEHGHSAALRKFKKKFPTLTESTIRPWVKRYKENLKEKRKSNKKVPLKIGQTSGRPLLLDVGLNLELRAMTISLRTTETLIKQHVVRGVMIDLVLSYHEKFDKYVKFEVIWFWVSYLYQRMKSSRSAATTSRPVITRSLWIEDSFFSKFHKRCYFTTFLTSSS